MAGARYEVRVEGLLSERARGAFPGMGVAHIRPQTSIYTAPADRTDLRKLLGVCSDMGLRLIALRQLPDMPHDCDRSGPAADQGEADRTSRA